jgi:hypothetical protein
MTSTTLGGHLIQPDKQAAAYQLGTTRHAQPQQLLTVSPKRRSVRHEA